MNPLNNQPFGDEQSLDDHFKGRPWVEAPATAKAAHAKRVSDPERAIRRAYGLTETIVAKLRKDDLEVRFVSDDQLAVGRIVIEHMPQGPVAGFVPMELMGRHPTLAMDGAFRTAQRARERWYADWARVAAIDEWWRTAG